MQSSNGRPRADGGGADGSADHREDHVPSPAEEPGSVRYEDPWYDALASGWGESDGPGGQVPVPGPGIAPARREGGDEAVVDVYLEVQRSAAFREVRSTYRRFVVPGVVVFLSWYVGYVVAATTAPGLMARPVAGAVNVAMLAGLGQFLTTFLFAWAYARHARLRRDRAALELRWDTQELTRGAQGGVA
ncbi:DUF485 domain-containing protein [Streptomyces spinosirectus]|uniref:DUF485 domain-containing protein n=1 Tax=Streptomyces TaxID=1883 RepID=UPI000D3C1B0D|nr:MULTISPECIES: DUF485 domain-containing protein [Streptomyces]MBY8338792.1 DUF485 domain-containing protein [Streptomyces plumbidurans]UIR20896.1 DUF485 domain-containing protein [Streptomyces spinosirectus]